jgi:methionine sulfoxide reductase heme-binding subunit
VGTRTEPNSGGRPPASLRSCARPVPTGRSAPTGGPLPWLKPAVFTGALMPLVALGLRAAQGRLSADPIAYVLNQFGLLTLIFLIATLSLTPLRKLTGWSWPIRIRRMLGLFAFFYACLHFTTYLALDQSFRWPAIWADLTKRKFIYVGFTAFVLLWPLALTSTNASVRRLGAARWQRLHRLVYLIATLGVIHFIWRVKKDFSQPLAYGAVLAALLLFRVWDAWRTKRTKRARATARAGPESDPSSAG